MRLFFDELEMALHNLNFSNSENASRMYPVGFSKKISLILKEVFEEYVSFFEERIKNGDYFPDRVGTFFAADLDEKEFEFYYSVILKLRQAGLSEEFLDSINSIDLANFKNLKGGTVNKSAEKIIADMQLRFSMILSEPEKKYILLIRIMRMGMMDATNYLYQLMCISKFLEKRGILFNFKAFLYKSGFGNMTSLSISRNFFLKREPNLFEILSQRVNEKTDDLGEIGCPFVKFLMPTVNKFIEILIPFFDSVYERYYDEDSLTTNYKGYGFMFLKFKFDLDSILKLQYVSKKK